MNILELITQDHRKVEELFSKIDDEKDSKKLYKLFDDIYRELTLHTKAEELVFYPALREDEGADELLEEAAEEHNAAKILLEQMRQLKPIDPEFRTKLKYLQDAVSHHVKEEEGEIFAAFESFVEHSELQELGEQFQAAKAKLKPDVEMALSS